MLNKNGAHQAKRKNGLGRGKGGLGAKKKKKWRTTKTCFRAYSAFGSFVTTNSNTFSLCFQGSAIFLYFSPFPNMPLTPFVFVGHANFPCEFTLTCVKVIVSNFALSIGVRYEYQSSPTMFSKQKKKKPAKTNPFPIPNNWAQGKRGQQKVMEYFDKIVF